jgi:signal transduction histidine kinase
MRPARHARKAGALGLWLLWLMMCPAALAQAAPAVALDVTRLHGGFSLVEQVQVLEDPAGRLTLADIVGARRDAGFTTLRSEATFGFTDSAFWLRFTAHNPDEHTRLWWLELAFPHLDHIELYAVRANGRVEHTSAGDLRSFADRQVDVPNFVFPQGARPHETVRYYVRVESSGALRAPLRAWVPLEYLSHETRRDLVLWLFYGAVLIMVCYNLGVAVLLRTREYLLHVGLLLSVGGAIFALSGQMFQYLLPSLPQVANRMVALFIGLGLLFVQLYAREVTRNFPELHKIMRLYRYTLPPTLLLLPLTLLSKWGLRAVFVGVGLYLPIGAYQLYQMRIARVPQLSFYMVGFVSLAVSIPVAMLAHAKFIPPYPVAIWAAHFGCAAYAVFTSLALPARINVMSNRLAGLNVQLSSNVTDLKAALARAEHANDEARRATKVKDEFMATMSHELRTPLNAIINVPQGLLDDFPLVPSATCSACREVFILEPGEQLSHTTRCDVCQAVGTLLPGSTVQYTGEPSHTARFLRKIERSGQHLLQMVNGVLDFSKMEAGHLDLALEPLDLKSLLTESADAMSELAAAKGLTIQLSLDSSLEPGLGDPVRLRQVLLNLLSNAIKFSGSGGSIQVRWQRDGEADVFSVADQGIGIAPEDHERVFVSFEQVHKGDTRKYGGTGLGLSISRSLVRMHGGELWVESRLGAGATFKFSLPLRSARSSSAA